MEHTPEQKFFQILGAFEITKLNYHQAIKERDEAEKDLSTYHVEMEKIRNSLIDLEVKKKDLIPCFISKSAHASEKSKAPEVEKSYGLFPERKITYFYFVRKQWTVKPNPNDAGLKLDRLFEQQTEFRGPAQFQLFNMILPVCPYHLTLPLLRDILAVKPQQLDERGLPFDEGEFLIPVQKKFGVFATEKDIIESPDDLINMYRRNHHNDYVAKALGLTIPQVPLLPQRAYER